MDTELVGRISGLVVLISAIPYGLRTHQGKIHPNLTSWSLWSLISLALLLTYKSSGAGSNLWPAIFGFINPTVIAILIVKRHGGWTRPNAVEKACLVFGILSLGTWFFVRESKELSQYALLLAILADACAAIPTIIFVWKQPDGDRPFAWTFFALGYGLAIFAVTERSFSNYVLPVYMFFGALLVAAPLIAYRWRAKVRLTEWI